MNNQKTFGNTVQDEKPTHSRKHICKPTRAYAQTKAYKRVSAFPAQLAHRALEFAHAQKNKINLCSVDRWVGLIKIKNEGYKADRQTNKIIRQQLTRNIKNWAVSDKYERINNK